MRRKLDPVWLNGQYSARGRIPEYSQTLLRWAHASAQARAALSRRLDIRYGDGLNETLDVFPTHRRHAPVLVFLHGGLWRGLDKADHSFIAPAFVREGVSLVLPNYALCPAATIEQIVMQSVRAVAWVSRNIDRLGGDPDRIYVVGHSAGGHLAAMMASCLWREANPELPPDPVRGALAISGLFDLEAIRCTPFLQQDLGLTRATARKLSPYLFPPPRVPLLAVVGGQESDEYKRQSALIRSAWGAAAVPVYEVLPNAHHFDMLEELVRPGSRLHQLTLDLLHDRPVGPSRQPAETSAVKSRHAAL